MSKKGQEMGSLPYNFLKKIKIFFLSRQKNTLLPRIILAIFFIFLFTGYIFVLPAKAQDVGLHLEVPLEMVEKCLGSSTSVATVFTRTQMGLNTANYDGTTYYFEVVAENADASAKNITLRNVTDGTDITSVSAALGSSATRIRSGPFSPTSGSKVYAIKLDTTTSTSQLKVWTARIIVSQVNATKTRVQIPLVTNQYDSSAYANEDGSNDSVEVTTSVPYTQVTPNRIYRYKKVPGDFSTLTGNCWELEGVMGSSNASGTTTVGLHNISGPNLVTGAEISTTGINTIYAPPVAFASNATNFTDNGEFEIYTHTNNASYQTRVYAMRLYITVTTLTKAQTWWRIFGYISAFASARSDNYSRQLIITNNFSNPTVYNEITGYCVYNADHFWIRDHGTNDSGTGGSNVNGSAVNFNSASKIRIRTSAIAAGDFTSGDRYYGYNDGVGVSGKGVASQFVVVEGAINVPTVQTDAATSVTGTGATLNGDITVTGGEDCDERGFDYRVQGAGGWTSWTETGSYYGTGAYSHAISGLIYSTTYEFRAKAKNRAGWGYGSTLTFTTDAPAINLSLSASSSDFGNLSMIAIGTSIPNITVTVSTNATNGYTLYVRDQGSGAAAGLYKSSTSYLIPSSTATLSAGTEGYGIQVSTSGGTVSSPYNVSGDNVGALQLTFQSLGTSAGPTSGNHTYTVTHKAAIKNTTESGSYLDVITYMAAGNF